MAHSQIVTKYSATAGSMTTAQLTALLSGISLKLGQLRTVGLVPISDVTGTVGQIVSRTTTLNMGSIYTQTSNIALDSGALASPIRSVGLTGGVHTDYAAPPIVSFSDPFPAASGAVAVARMGLGTRYILAGGSGYTAQTTVAATNGQLDPAGTPAVLVPVIAAGVIIGVTVVSPGVGYNRFTRLVFTDPGGGSGATGIAALKPVSIKLFGGGNGYTAPTMTLSPVFQERCPDSGNQAGMVAAWMLGALLQGTGLAIKETPPAVS